MCFLYTKLEQFGQVKQGCLAFIDLAGFLPENRNGKANVPLGLPRKKAYPLVTIGIYPGPSLVGLLTGSRRLRIRGPRKCGKQWPTNYLVTLYWQLTFVKLCGAQSGNP